MNIRVRELNICRLQHLANNVLVRVEKEHLPFYMGVWVTSDSCGSAACAAGWACRDHVFQEQGLQLDASFPCFMSKLGFEAVEAFFGLSRQEAWFLFDPEAYPDIAKESDITPADVRARIYELIGEEHCPECAKLTKPKEAE